MFPMQVPPVELQAGVLRANCIDCLDRTNVAQFTYGHAALGRQLHALGLKDEPGLDLHASVVGHLMHMYEAMGHVLARQARLCAAVLHLIWLAREHLAGLSRHAGPQAQQTYVTCSRPAPAQPDRQVTNHLAWACPQKHPARLSVRGPSVCA